MSAFRTQPLELGHGYAVEFRWQRDRFDAVWSPEMPAGKRARKIMPAYQRARHHFLSKVASELGINIAVMDGTPDPTGGIA
jgi:hypothetical protein